MDLKLKYLLVLVSLALLGGLAGCSAMPWNADAKAAAEAERPTITKFEPQDIDNTPHIGIGGLGTNQPKIKISGVTDDIHIDSQPLNIENITDEDLTGLITLEYTSGNTTDIDTGLEYEPTPLAVKDWVKLGAIGEFTFPAYSLTSIPVVIDIPKGVILPQRWEFDLKVAQFGGMLSTAFAQRWLITMR